MLKYEHLLQDVRKHNKKIAKTILETKHQDLIQK